MQVALIPFERGSKIILIGKISHKQFPIFPERLFKGLGGRFAKANSIRTLDANIKR